MEERCIANDVAYASLHNQHLGKQQIKRSTGQEKNESKMLYPHFSRAFGGGYENTADLF